MPKRVLGIYLSLAGGLLVTGLFYGPVPVAAGIVAMLFSVGLLSTWFGRLR